MRVGTLAVTLVASAVVCASSVSAQSDLLSREAVAESLKVLGALRKRTTDNPRDTSAWLRRGMVASALSERTLESPPIFGLDRRLLRIEAGDALDRALALDGETPAHWIALAEFRISGSRFGEPGSHAAATEMIKRMHHDLWPAADSATRVKLLLLVANDQWFFYNKFESRALTGFLQPPVSVFAAAGADSTSPLPRLLKAAYDRILEVYGKPASFELRGEQHYLAAESFYAEARKIAPTDARVFGAVARLYAARERWQELKAIAAERIRLVPDDPWGWMTRGLAEQRMAASVPAAASLDSGLARLDPTIRRQLTGIERLLRPVEVASFMGKDAVAQEHISTAWWRMAEPLWSVASANPRTEFLARIAYAELRFGSNPVGLSLGSDTPLGNLYIRYGPPQIKQANFWLYDSGLVFSRFGSRFALESTHPDVPLLKRIENWQPVRWDNLSKIKIDSMSAQVARFRSREDSVDVLIAARVTPPRDVAIVNARQLTNIWIAGLASAQMYSDSVQLTPDSLVMSTKRLGVGEYYFRMEGVTPTATTAERASWFLTVGNDSLSGFAMRGFGMSDVVLADSVSSNGPVNRWSDLRLRLTGSSTARGNQIALVWETYDAGAVGGLVRYDVEIRVEPEERRGVANINAEIAPGLRGVTNVRRRQTGRGVTFQYSRETPYAQTLVESTQLEIGSLPQGSYQITVGVRDNVSGRSTSRTLSLRVRR